MFMLNNLTLYRLQPINLGTTKVNRRIQNRAEYWTLSYKNGELKIGKLGYCASHISPLHLYKIFTVNHDLFNQCLFYTQFGYLFCTPYFLILHFCKLMFLICTLDIKIPSLVLQIFHKQFDASNIKVGKNILINRLRVLNNQTEYDWLNKSLNSYKLICKSQFLS